MSRARFTKETLAIALSEGAGPLRWKFDRAIMQKHDPNFILLVDDPKFSRQIGEGSPHIDYRYVDRTGRTPARHGINPFTKEPTIIPPISKSVEENEPRSPGHVGFQRWRASAYCAHNGALTERQAVIQIGRWERPDQTPNRTAMGVGIGNKVLGRADAEARLREAVADLVLSRLAEVLDEFRANLGSILRA